MWLLGRVARGSLANAKGKTVQCEEDTKSFFFSTRPPHNPPRSSNIHNGLWSDREGDNPRKRWNTRAKNRSRKKKKSVTSYGVKETKTAEHLRKQKLKESQLICASSLWHRHFQKRGNNSFKKAAQEGTLVGIRRAIAEERTHHSSTTICQLAMNA